MCSFKSIDSQNERNHSDQRNSCRALPMRMYARNAESECTADALRSQGDQKRSKNYYETVSLLFRLTSWRMESNGIWNGIQLYFDSKIRVSRRSSMHRDIRQSDFDFDSHYFVPLNLYIFG